MTSLSIESLLPSWVIMRPKDGIASLYLEKKRSYILFPELNRPRCGASLEDCQSISLVCLLVFRQSNYQLSTLRTTDACENLLLYLYNTAL